MRDIFILSIVTVFFVFVVEIAFACGAAFSGQKEIVIGFPPIISATFVRN